MPFSREDQLDKDSTNGSRPPMAMKCDAPSFTRPELSEARLKKMLVGLPEPPPSRNAFAEEAQRRHKHMLETNAFYQEALRKARANPPTEIHPALRVRNHHSEPLPDSQFPFSPFPPTVSAVSVNAGLGKEGSTFEIAQDNAFTRSLKLVPSMDEMAIPTGREIIELHRSAPPSHEQSRDEDYVQVGIHDYTNSTREAGDNASKGSKKVTLVEPQLQAKTPKRPFLGRLRLPALLTNMSPATRMPKALDKLDEDIPVKARAVLGHSPRKMRPRSSLGSSPSRSDVARSPSKRVKGFFRRGSSSNTDLSAPKALFGHTETKAQVPSLPPSTATKTTSSGSYSSYDEVNGQHQVPPNSQRSSILKNGHNNGVLARSQSLKHFDHSLPPTPPAKNTPPHAKVTEEAESRKIFPRSQRKIYSPLRRPPVSRATASKVIANSHTDSDRLGGYRNRPTPNLVTQPSLYSLHACVDPNNTDPTTFEEMKARIDALGLEGFNLPTENVRNSPTSNYSPAFPPLSEFNTPDAPPAEWFEHQAKSIVCSPVRGRDINIRQCLAKDTSFDKIASPCKMSSQSPVQDSTPRRGLHLCLQDDLTDLEMSPASYSHLSAVVSPLHHLPQTTYVPPPRTSSKVTPSTPKGGHEEEASTDSGVDAVGSCNDEPTTPPRSNDLFQRAPYFPAEAQYAIHNPNNQDGTPADNVFDPNTNVDPSKPPPSIFPSQDKLDQMMEILDKMNACNTTTIGAIANEIRASNQRFHDRLAAIENSHSGRATPTPPPCADGTLPRVRDVDSNRILNQNRVLTEAAIEYYNIKQAHDTAAEAEPAVEMPRPLDDDGPQQQRQSDADTIAELKETNTRLMELMDGFAEKIKALEKRVNHKF